VQSGRLVTVNAAWHCRIICIVVNHAPGATDYSARGRLIRAIPEPGRVGKINIKFIPSALLAEVAFGDVDISFLRALNLTFQ